MSDTSSPDDHEQALTLMKFQLIFAAIFCEDKMDYLTPETTQNNVPLSGHKKPSYFQ